MPRSHRPAPPIRRRRNAGFIRLALLPALLALLPAGSAAAYWSPPQRATWQWQLSGVIDPSVAAQVYDVDGFDTAPSTVAALRGGGRRTVCYFSAGSFEDWRPDAAAFPAAVLGSANGWPGERWNTPRYSTLRAGHEIEKDVDGSPPARGQAPARP